MPYPLGYENEAKIFRILHAQVSKMVYIFIDLKLPSLITGSIKSCKHFPTKWVISQKINFNFLNMHAYSK